MDGLRAGRVAILGLGLLGGSLGLALRERGAAREVAGYDLAPDSSRRARERGAIDQACRTAPEAVAGAEMVILAVPVLAMRELLAEIGPALRPDALVTDTGSTKAAVVRWAEELLPEPARFVGGHPMAGREHAGIESAQPDLLTGCVWALTPTDRTAPDALARVAALARALEAKPVELEPRRHDEAVAAISHLPLVASALLALTAADDPAWPVARLLAAGGFRDTTRLASGDPQMARDICLTNARALDDALGRSIAHLQAARAAIRDGDGETLRATFTRAKGERDAWLRG